MDLTSLSGRLSFVSCFLTVFIYISFTSNGLLMKHQCEAEEFNIKDTKGNTLVLFHHETKQDKEQPD